MKLLDFKITSWILYLTFFVQLSYANNLQVSGITLTNKNTVNHSVFVQFNLSWENSWRLNTAPANWDAAWIFIKYRVNGGLWNHASISSNDADHVAPSDAFVDAANDGKGAFIYRSETGSGNNSWNSIQLKWLYGVDGVDDNSLNIEIRVFGIEMVYVNQGNFYVGDGLDTYKRLFNANAVNPDPLYALIGPNPVTLKVLTNDFDDNALETSGILVDGDGGIDTLGNTTLNNPNFPTGYHAFYCMKYEISQEQYAAFLNTLTRTQQDRRVYRDLTGVVLSNPFAMSHLNGVERRNGIYAVNTSGDAVSPVTFYCNVDTAGNNINLYNQPTDGQNLGGSYISWLDGTAYADWAALRPMTELEFEKACRGPEIPIQNEFAWHSTSIINSGIYTFSTATLNTDSEYMLNPATNGTTANAAYANTTGHASSHPGSIQTMLRTGIFATSSTNRISAGASYYGIMELSGMLNERCVTIGVGRGRQFMGTHGDGILDFTSGREGNATNTDWPGVDLNKETFGANYVQNGAGYKGGDWNDASTTLEVSDRYYTSLDPFGPNIGAGFRCVRTAN
ncbi:MAG: SUMF1/EgtB/PvdO family nonheme iron enzyme [Bacteroidales bacterium]